MFRTAVCLLLLAASASPLLAEEQTVTESGTNGVTSLLFMPTATITPAGATSWSLLLMNDDYLVSPAPDLAPPSARSYRDMDFDDSQATLSFSHGFGNRLELAGALPYHRLQQNEGDLAGYLNGYPYRGEITEFYAGDLRLGAKLVLARGGASTFTMSARADLPTGEEDSGVSTGQPNFGGGLHWSGHRAHISGTYLKRSDRDADATPFAADFDVSDEIRLDAGYVAPGSFLGAKVDWIGELNSVMHFAGERDPADAFYAGVGFRGRMSDHWKLTMAVRYNIAMATSNNSSHPIGGLIAFHYRTGR